MRVRERRAPVERESHSVRGCGDGEDAIGRPLGCGVPDHEEVVVVVDQFVGGGQPPAQVSSYRADQRLVLRLKLIDKALELLLHRSGVHRMDLPGWLHGVPFLCLNLGFLNAGNAVG